MPRIKICCIASIAEARLGRDAGADAIGLVSAMPSGPGILSEDRIAELLRQIGLDGDTFLLTSRTDPARIAAQHRRCPASHLQLVTPMLAATGRAVRTRLPGVHLVAVIHVLGEASVDVAVAASEWADALLLDSGRPDANELGGTGRTHDWAVSRRIVEAVERPVWLAGGLNPLNVAEAVAAVRPFGVDVCSGVRTEGRLDPEKLRAFVAALR